MFSTYRSHTGTWRAWPAWWHFIPNPSSSGGTVRDLILAAWGMLQVLLVGTQCLKRDLSSLLSHYSSDIYFFLSGLDSNSLDAKGVWSTSWAEACSWKAEQMYSVSTETMEIFFSERKLAILVSQCLNTHLSSGFWWTYKLASKI